MIQISGYTINDKNIFAKNVYSLFIVWQTHLSSVACKRDEHIAGKWLIRDTKHHDENYCKCPAHTCMKYYTLTFIFSNEIVFSLSAVQWLKMITWHNKGSPRNWKDRSDEKNIPGRPANIAWLEHRHCLASIDIDNTDQLKGLILSDVSALKQMCVT